MNTQFWTKLSNEQMKNALRHKFNVMTSQSQFMVEAGKIESEFTCKNSNDSTGYCRAYFLVKADILDSIKDRLSALESKSNTPSTPLVDTRSTASPEVIVTGNPLTFVVGDVTKLGMSGGTVL